MREHERARKWLERNELTQRELAERTGYTAMSINWFLKGFNPPRNGQKGAPISEWVWQRWKRTCGDVDAEMHGRRKGEKFDW